MEAYSDALLLQQTEVRPINAAIGSVLVESSNSTSVASFVYSVLLNANPDLDATFYGTGYTNPSEPYDPKVLDSIPPEITESTEQPESQFGFEWPPPAAKSIFGDEYEESRQRLLKAISRAKTAPTAKWSEQTVVERQKALTEHYAPLVGKAMNAGITGVPAAIAAAQAEYATTKKASGGSGGSGIEPTPAAAAATQAVSANVKVNPAQAQQILRYLYGDSYLAGAHAAGVQLGRGAAVLPSLKDYIGKVDWEAWEPGDAVAGGFVADGGLADLLDAQGIGDIKSLIGDIFDNALNRLGNTLADCITEGLGVDKTAAAIADQVDSNAYMIANTETARATSAATMDTYTENDVEQFNWLAEDDACPSCRDNADDGPYDVGGDPTQPEHPNCRCCYLPVIMVGGVNVAPTSDEGDQAGQGDGEGFDGEPPI